MCGELIHGSTQSGPVLENVEDVDVRSYKIQRSNG